jgi:hypothetical protein
MARQVLIIAIALLVVACTAPQSAPQSAPTSSSLEVDAIAQTYSGYTLERAEREGYKRDSFCLDASDFGHDPTRGAMGFHATNASLLRGPIDVNRPQALMFDEYGRVLGVEYEIMAEAAREVPALFGRAFTKLPAHAGVAHEHYALHLWFIENPSGRFADFNPRLTCPPKGAPGAQAPATPVPESTIVPEDHNAAH